ncbi:MAG: YraN family protein [Bacteroidia bacterium]|nr:YraN family protein [Bacteroidia bacterium]
MAADFLRQRGYKILFQRWRYGIYEIDIVAWHEGELAFVEVRTLTAGIPWHPEASISMRKQKGLRRAIELFLAENPSYENLTARIDVVAVRTTQPVEVLVWVDAFR